MSTIANIRIATAEDFPLNFTKDIEFKVTDEMVMAFAKMSGDYNPIHTDEAFAKHTRFGRRIAHGMITGALISSSLVQVFGQGGVYLGQTMKFVNPVFIDDDVIVTVKVNSVRKEKGIASIETLVKKKTGETVVKGEATIMMGDFIMAKP